MPSHSTLPKYPSSSPASVPFLLLCLLPRMSFLPLPTCQEPTYSLKPHLKDIIYCKCSQKAQAQVIRHSSLIALQGLYEKHLATCLSSCKRPRMVFLIQIAHSLALGLTHCRVSVWELNLSLLLVLFLPVWALGRRSVLPILPESLIIFLSKLNSLNLPPLLPHHF